MPNVKSYTDKQLLDKVASMEGFKGFPNKYWLIGVRSNEDAFNQFDDKMYTFKGEEFVSVTICTTNKGGKGTAVMLEGLYYDCFEYGLHRHRTPAIRQVRGVNYRRDYTSDKKTNPTTEIFSNLIYMNIHSASHDLNQKIVKTNIGGWSEGCQVLNDIPFYKEWIKQFKFNGGTTYCLLEEF